MNLKKILEDIKNSKKVLFIVLVVVLVLVIGIYIKKSTTAAPKQIYEVAVAVRSQNNPDREEDKKTSLKVGDVLVVQKDGHNWSKTESISYLILRMNLTEEQSQKITRAKTREISYKEMSEEERSQIDEEKKRAKERGDEYTQKPREETLIAREYRIDMEEFIGFKAVDLIASQPYENEVYDWSLVEKKK